MKTVIELETESGTMLYINPDHVASVLGLAGDGEPISVIDAGAIWRVKGNALDLAAHIFSMPFEHGRRTAFARPGHAVRVKRVGVSVPLEELLG
ncbi:MAG: hypothetical protein PGN12_06030 [Sphingomonas phyllosphaerae]